MVPSRFVCEVIMFYKVTYNRKFKRANVHNYGCNFRCRGCSYKLKNCGQKIKPIGLEKIKKALKKLDIERVHFVGGEPTTNPKLPGLINFVKNNLKVYACLGHTNGSNIVDVDESNVSIKSYTDRLHVDYTGASNTAVLKNFEKVYKMDIKMKVSSVFIPDYVDNDEIEKIAKFVADIDENIPYHLVGYLPVPETPWRSPGYEEMKKAFRIAKQYLKNVTFSSLSKEEFFNLSSDPRYKSVRVA